MLKLNKIEYSNFGQRINYEYEYTSNIKKYFNEKLPLFIEYDRNISSVPKSISIIPFLANIMPIAWFVGFDVYVDELDKDFYESLEKLKKEFAQYFPQINKGERLYFNNLIENNISGSHSSMLFSGGLDSFDTLIRNIEKDPFLISLLGADIDIEDKKRWNEFKKLNEKEKILNNEKLHYVTSNLRTFYTYHVDMLVDIGWWGKIQHGMALITTIAPISYIYNITTIYIASSQTEDVKKVGWGSTKETDEKTKWANIKVIHEGYEYNRPDKIDNVIKFAHNTNYYCNLRVCYSELRDGKNCNRCPKCQRTILGFILSGENPSKFGFKVPNDFYNIVFKNFDNNSSMTVGIKYQWECLQDKANQRISPYILKDQHLEKEMILKFSRIKLNKILTTNDDIKTISFIKKIKFILISKFPKLFNYYMKIKHK